jgi:pimeloyl-ACP methyl ester carboxylesterase
VLEWAPAHGGSGATALLLHGFGDAAATWDRVASRLVAAGLRALAPDMRGFGDGPRVPAGGYYHFVDYVADVADIVDAAIGQAPLFLVGHSMGGSVSALYAGAFPERVTKLALVEGLGPPDTPLETSPDRMRGWIEQVRGVRAREERVVGGMEDALRRLVANHPKVDAATLRARLPQLVRELPDGRVAWLADPLHKTVGPVPFVAQSYMAFARRVTCPVLNVSGGPEGWHVPGADERLASFRTHETVELAGAGHMMHWTRPEALADALVRFWTGETSSS